MISPSGYLQIVLQARGIAGHSVVEALNDMAASGGNSQSPRLALQDEQLARIGPALGGLVTHDENRIDGSVAIQILIGLRHHLIVLGDQARQFLRRDARRLRRKCASGVPSLRQRWRRDVVLLPDCRTGRSPCHSMFSSSFRSRLHPAPAQYHKYT